jgi:cholesterol transport system auxiliary component
MTSADLGKTACVLIACLLSACGVGRPVHYYTINPPATQVPAEAKPSGLVLVVGHITTAEALEDSRIRYRSGSNEVGAYEYHRWTERPAIFVRDLLLHTLRASGQFRQVQEAGSTAAGDYLIRGHLQEFCEADEPGMQTRVSLRLEVVDRKNGLVAWDRQYHHDEPVNGKKMTGIVVSFERNLQNVINDGATGIESFLASRR